MNEVNDIKALPIVEVRTNVEIGRADNYTANAIDYISKITDINFDKVYTDNTAIGLLKVMAKRSHIICVAVVKSNYQSIKNNVIEFENQDIVNYVIGHNLEDKSYMIGDIVHFGSNVVPLEIKLDNNINDVEYIKKQIILNKQVIVDNNWFTSGTGAKEVLALKEKGIDVGSKYILNSDPVKLVKIMMYNSSLISAVSPFDKIEDIKLHTVLR